MRAATAGAAEGAAAAPRSRARRPGQTGTLVRLVGVESFLPPRVRTSAEVETIVAERSNGYDVRAGIVELMTGIRERRVVEDGVNCSDLAAGAARRLLERTGTDPADVDLVIFAAAGQDLIEPATANIVQEKVGTSAAVFDLKNACNSFLNGMQVAEAMIQTGAARRVLVTVGETPSKAICWTAASHEDLRLNFPGYTLGDAGAAALLAPSENGAGIFHRDFVTRSRYWDVATLPGGGSMHPRGDEYSYIRGDGTGLKDAFADLGPAVLHGALRATGTTLDDFSRVLVHQASVPFLEEFVRVTGVHAEQIELTLPHLGNMAAATLPVAYAQAWKRGAIAPGDRVLWVGLAGGISVGVMMMDV